MPKEFITYANLLTSKCMACEGQIAKINHLKESHQLNLPEPEQLQGVHKIFGQKT